MEVRLFGELEAVAGGVPVPVRGAKQRALLALLALQRGQPVSADRLIDVLWGDGQAANPANALQAQIGQLRRTLGPAAILTTEAGYALAAGPGEVDVVRFEQLVAKGRRLAADGEMEPASEPATGNPDPSFTDPRPGAGHTRRPSSERPASTPMNGVPPRPGSCADPCRAPAEGVSFP